MEKKEVVGESEKGEEMKRKLVVSVLSFFGMRDLILEALGKTKQLRRHIAYREFSFFSLSTSLTLPAISELRQLTTI